MSVRLWQAIALAGAIVITGSTAIAAELEVNGGANVDGDFTFESSLSDSEVGAPLVRTSIEVSDDGPGVFSYLAAADITIPKLRIYGSLNNAGGALFSEVPLLFANATLTDTIFITAPSPDPYIVTAQMIVDGTLDVAGSNGRVNAQLDINPVNAINSTVTKTYTTTPTTPEERLLTIQREFVGDAEFDISARLFFFVAQIDPGVSITADFSNSAIIVLTVTGAGSGTATVASGSGAFASAVPIPASLPLLLSGIAGLLWRKRAVAA